MKSQCKIKVFFFLLLGIIISMSTSCKNKNNELVVSDNILFHDFDPDIVITSTKYYGPDSFHFCSRTPTPIDSTATFRFDINSDLIDDFEASVQHWIYIGSGSSFTLEPCLRYENFKTTVYPLNDSDKISLKSTGSKVNEYLYGETISGDSEWSEWNSGLYTNSVQYQYAYSPTNQEFYLGIMIYKENRYYYGWILVNVSEDQLIIKESAINLSENLKIVAGQKY